jgi:hypothetical protein
MARLNIGKNVMEGLNLLNFRELEPFDWYQVYTGVKDIITQYINKTDKILNVGSGNSSNFIKLP